MAMATHQVNPLLNFIAPSLHGQPALGPDGLRCQGGIFINCRW